MLWCCWLLGLSACRSLGTGRLDGVNWDERIREQLANARDVLGAGLAGEEAVVADAVEARRQDMHQKAADELVRGKRHHLVVSLLAFETIILPLEGNVLVVGRDQAAVGDGDAVGVARKVAQHFLRSPEWALGIDDPVFVAQRRQIGREGSCVCERSVLAEELQLADAMSDSKLLQDPPAGQAGRRLKIPIWMLLPECAEITISQRPHLGKQALLSLASLIISQLDSKDPAHDNLRQTRVSGCEGGRRGATSTSGPDDPKEMRCRANRRREQRRSARSHGPRSSNGLSRGGEKRQ